MRSKEEEQKFESRDNQLIIIPLAPLPLEKSVDQSEKQILGTFKLEGKVQANWLQETILGLQYIFQYLPDVDFVRYLSPNDYAFNFLKFLQNTNFASQRYTVTIVPCPEDSHFAIIVDSETKKVFKRYLGYRMTMNIYITAAPNKTESPGECITNDIELFDQYLPGYTIASEDVPGRVNPFVHLAHKIFRALNYSIEISSEDVKLQKVSGQTSFNQAVPSLFLLPDLIYRAANCFRQQNPDKMTKAKSLESRADRVITQAPMFYFKEALSTPVKNTLKTENEWRNYFRSYLFCNPRQMSVTHKEKCESFHVRVIQSAIDPRKTKRHRETQDSLTRVWLQFRALCYINNFKKVMDYFHVMRAADIHLNVLFMRSPEDGSTILHHLFASNQQAILKEIFSYFPKVCLTFKDKNRSMSPLDHAIFSGHLKLVIENLPSNLSEQDKIYLVVFAAEGGHLAQFPYLLDNLFFNSDSSTYAKSKKCLSVSTLRSVLTRLSSTNWVFTKAILDRYTVVDIPIWEAQSKTISRKMVLGEILLNLMLQEYRNYQVTQLLLAYGANPNTCYTAFSGGIHANKSASATLLSLAIHHGRLTDIRLLLMFGANLPLKIDELFTYSALPIIKEGGEKIKNQHYLTSKKRFVQGLFVLLEWYVMVADYDYEVFAKIIIKIIETRPKALHLFLSHAVYKSQLFDGEWVDTIFSHQVGSLPREDYRNFNKIKLNFKINVVDQQECLNTPSEIFSQRFTRYFFKFFINITAGQLTFESQSILNLPQIMADELLLTTINTNLVEYNPDQHLLAISLANYGYLGKNEQLKKIRLFYHSFYCREDPALKEEYQVYDKVQDAKPLSIEYFLTLHSDISETKFQYYINKHLLRYLRCHLMATDKLMQLVYPENFITGVIQLLPLVFKTIYSDLRVIGIEKPQLVTVWHEQAQADISLEEYLNKVVCEHLIEFIIKYEADNLLSVTDNGLLNLINTMDLSMPANVSPYIFYISCLQRNNLLPIVMIKILESGNEKTLRVWLTDYIKATDVLLKPYQFANAVHPAVLTTVIKQLLSYPENINYDKNIYILKEFFSDFKESIAQAFIASGEKLPAEYWKIVESSLTLTFCKKAKIALKMGNVFEFYYALQSPHPFQKKTVTADVLISIIENINDNQTEKLFALLDQHQVDFEGNFREKLPIITAIKANKPTMAKALLKRVQESHTTEENYKQDGKEYEFELIPFLTAITNREELLASSMLADTKIDLKLHTVVGQIALATAIKTWQPNIVKALLLHGVNTFPSKSGVTTFHLYANAVTKVSHATKRRKMFDILTAHEQNFSGSLHINEPDKNGVTPILSLCQTSESIIFFQQQQFSDSNYLEVNDSLAREIFILMNTIGASCFNDCSPINGKSLLYYATCGGWSKVLGKLFAYSKLDLTTICSQSTGDLQTVAFDSMRYHIEVTYMLFIKMLTSIMLNYKDKSPSVIATTIEILLPHLINKINVSKDEKLIQQIIIFSEQYASQFQAMNRCLYNPSNVYQAKNIVANIIKLIVLSKHMMSMMFSPRSSDFEQVVMKMKSILEKCSDVNVGYALCDLYAHKDFIPKIGKHTPIQLFSKFLTVERFSAILTLPLPKVEQKTVINKLADCINLSNIIDFDELYIALKLIGKPFADILIDYNLISTLQKNIAIKNKQPPYKSRACKLSLQLILFRLILEAASDKDRIKPNSFERLFEISECRSLLLGAEHATGYSLLHLLLKRNFNEDNHILEWVIFLVYQGISLDKKCVYGKTPIDLIPSEKNKSLISKLKVIASSSISKRNPVSQKVNPQPALNSNQISASTTLQERTHAPVASQSLFKLSSGSEGEDGNEINSGVKSINTSNKPT